MLGNRDAHALSPVGHFLWDAGPMNETIRRQKVILSLKFVCGTDLEPKNWFHDQ